jgi:hypothetical protein
MRGRTRLGFDEFLHHLALVGVTAFVLWLAASALGFTAGLVSLEQVPAIRFMTAILVLVMPDVVYADLRELWLRRLSPDERAGFAQRG